MYVRHGTPIVSLIHGAGHEGGRRAGTENVAGIVGLGEACAIAAETMGETFERLQSLRDRLYAGIAVQVKRLYLNGHPTERLPNTLNVSFAGLDANALLDALPEIAASTGSACRAGTTELSPVLTAMGVPPEVALGAVRFSLGKQNDQPEIDRAVELAAKGADLTGAAAAVSPASRQRCH